MKNKSATILVAEKNAQIYSSVCCALKQAGFPCETAAPAAEQIGPAAAEVGASRF